MKNIQFTHQATEYQDTSQLLAEEQRLLEQAFKAKEKAYAPYSKFSVGAAILLENDIIVTGNNQENAAYPSGMCAERVAIWNVGSNHPNQIIKKIMIVAGSKNYVVDQPVGPCGACRQTLLEYEINQKQPIELFFMGSVGKIIKVNSIKALLPFSFDGSFL